MTTIQKPSLLADSSPDWWKTAIGYHIYVPSFMDSNGDGIGDIPGILERLSHVQSLGVDFIWLSPFYASPQNDMGYDISDYTNVHPAYGTLADMQKLIDACHKIDLRIMLDLVVNHTSHEHRWFQASKSGKNSEKRDWYHWRPPKYDQFGNKRPPNNWLSVFGGSAWEWDEPSQEYYLHIYLKEQPDLNWGCQELRQAVYNEALRFWLEKGVDGFRIDTVCIYAKDPSFPDAEVTNPNSEFQLGAKYYANRPENLAYLREMRQVVDEYSDNGRYIAMIGEYSGGTTPDIARQYCRPTGPLDGGFHKQLMDLERTATSKWILSDTKALLPRLIETHAEWQSLVQAAWTTAFLENHDIGRSISRFKGPRSAENSDVGKLLAVFLATSSGTLFLYQGQEIGMANMPESWGIEEYKDRDTTRYYESVKNGLANGESLEYAMSSIRSIARDHGRTPVQWDETVNAGFTSNGQPWMRVNDNHLDINVKKQESDINSVLEFWKTSIKLRKSFPRLFIYGRFQAVNLEGSPFQGTLCLYWKRGQQEEGEKSTCSKALVILNFGNQVVQLSEILVLSGLESFDGSMIATTFNVNDDVIEDCGGRVYVWEQNQVSKSSPE